ncbi:terminase gpA endonuclease subunit [Escherichia coli]|uniref:terminase gpA endonuclease subunit n=1 Tax=Escherichia coli TaxID=562 RepID=UPI000F53EA94|nr:terminase gpA endonuclease subunit [Escherichia coli]
MNISNSQVNRLRHFVRAGLRSLFRPEPQTAVELADANYYLPKESAYQEGRWETLPFQRAIMNAMGSDYIREVNVVKSARVGYSKMLLGVYAYFIEHKQRNTLIWLPTDGDAENFMKTHVEPTIRDIPSLLALAPWYGKKHRDNTLTMKRFFNGRGFWCLGGKAAKNYREKSVDVAGYDELAAFDEDIFDLTEAQQLTAEEQVEKWVDGRKKILWDSKKRRNEALDCFVYALAALRISISRWQLDLSALLASLQEEDGAATNKKTLADYARALSGEDE